MKWQICRWPFLTAVHVLAQILVRLLTLSPVSLSLLNGTLEGLHFCNSFLWEISAENFRKSFIHYYFQHLYPQDPWFLQRTLQVAKHHVPLQKLWCCFSSYYSSLQILQYGFNHLAWYGSQTVFVVLLLIALSSSEKICCIFHSPFLFT